MRKAVLLSGSESTDPALRSLDRLDAQVHRLASVLGDPEICGFDVTLMLNPTIGEATRSVERIFSEARPEDLLLFYYSGHGLLDAGGQLFFGLRDSDRSLLQSTALAA